MCFRPVLCIVVFMFVFNFLIPETGFAFKRYNKVVRYDKYFSKYSKRYFGPAFSWIIFKAQAVAESRLIPDAKSYVGAHGVMQIMPRTFTEIRKRNPEIKGLSNQARWNIAAGVYYDRNLWKLWKADRPFQDRLDFMLASYNAGKGNILKAQKLAKKRGLNPNLWASIKKVLPQITGRRSKETIEYIEKINIIREILH